MFRTTTAQSILGVQRQLRKPAIKQQRIGDRNQHKANRLGRANAVDLKIKARRVQLVSWSCVKRPQKNEGITGHGPLGDIDDIAIGKVRKL